MNERESIQLNLADFVVAVERVLDGCLSMLPSAGYFLPPRPASLGGTSLVVHGANCAAVCADLSHFVFATSTARV
jgi:hypothetical protein